MTLRPRPTRTEVLVRAFEHVIQDWGRTERTVVLMVAGAVLVAAGSAALGPTFGVIVRTLLP